MAQTTKDLPDSGRGVGRSQYFNFQYDDSLTPERGVLLATEMLGTCDDDFDLLVDWFSGRGLDMSPPIQVSINDVATDQSGNPIGYVGGHWGPSAGPFPLQLTINLGELPMASGPVIALARYLLIAEVSEMFMRAFDLGLSYPWFRFGEGNKGEALSRLLGAEFLRLKYPNLTEAPSLRSGGFLSSPSWLNSARTNFLEVNNESIDPADPDVGGGTLFLCYLHDQLGYSIKKIVNAGADHLSDVYENLTQNHKTREQVWDEFWDIVERHYPMNDVLTNQSVMYDPAFETVFPVPELVELVTPPTITWGPNPPPRGWPVARVVLSRPTPVGITVRYTFLAPGASNERTKNLDIPRGSSVATLPLELPADPDPPHPVLVQLVANYVDGEITRDISVVAPGDIVLPPLYLDVYTDDPCRIPFVENDEITIGIGNLESVLSGEGATYHWSVSGAESGPVDGALLVIPTLPAAGTEVSVSIVVTRGDNLAAKGTFDFTVRGAPSFDELGAEIRCRVNRLVNILPILNPEEAITGERVQLLREQTNLLARQLEKLL